MVDFLVRSIGGLYYPLEPLTGKRIGRPEESGPHRLDVRWRGFLHALQEK
jgi:hypothetical protein